MLATLVQGWRRVQHEKTPSISRVPDLKLGVATAMFGKSHDYDSNSMFAHSLAMSTSKRFTSRELCMNRRLQQHIALLSCLCFLTIACNSRSEHGKSTPPDFTGFWKEHCSDPFGVQIKKQAENLFSVSFCGPGGCFAPGTWQPNTPILGDPHYRLIDPTTLGMQHGESWQTYTKCTTDTNPKLDLATTPAEALSTSRDGGSPVTSPEAQSYVVQPAPSLPFLDWEACPFEGCTYREWTATSPVEVFDTWEPGRKHIATIPSKGAVTGISGVVITYKPGVIRLNKDLAQDHLRPGDTILTYTYRGEGFSAVWFKGRFYGDYDISFTKWPDGGGCGGDHCAADYVDLGEKVWWAKVKMKSGVVGWVNMNEARFDGVDQFAFVTPDSTSQNMKPAQ